MLTPEMKVAYFFYITFYSLKRPLIIHYQSRYKFEISVQKILHE